PSLYPSLLFTVRPRPPTSTLFPYTTLFRSLPSMATFEYQMPTGCDLVERVGWAGGRGGGPPRKPTLFTSYSCFLRSEKVGHLRRSEEHTSELQSRFDLVCRLLLEKK